MVWRCELPVNSPKRLAGLLSAQLIVLVSFRFRKDASCGGFVLDFLQCEDVGVEFSSTLGQRGYFLGEGIARMKR